jgi:hypothetical protein
MQRCGTYPIAAAMSTKRNWNLQKQLEMIMAIAAMGICRGSGEV